MNVFIASVLGHNGYTSLGVYHSTFDEVLESIKTDYRTKLTTDQLEKKRQQHPDFDFRVFRSERLTHNPTIVEVGLDSNQPTVSLGIYKIWEGDRPDWYKNNPKPNY